MLDAYGTGHGDDPMNQLGPRARRHRRITFMKLGLIKPLARDERG
jgi:hypothetical protein